MQMWNRLGCKLIKNWQKCFLAQANGEPVVGQITQGGQVGGDKAGGEGLIGQGEDLGGGDDQDKVGPRNRTLSKFSWFL